MMSLVFALTRSVRRLGVRMVPYLLLVHLGWGWPPPCQAQVLQAQLPLRQGQSALLTSIRLHKSDTLATANADSAGRVRFVLPPQAYRGFYRIVWPEGQSLVLWDGQSVNFIALGPDSVDILRGEAWQTYRSTRQSLLNLRSRRQLLLSLRREFPAAQNLHQAADQQIRVLEVEEQKLMDRINDPQAGTGMRFLRPEAPFLGRNPEEMRPQLRPGSYLRLANLRDTALVHHPVLANMIVEYYRLFEPDSVYSEEIQAMRFVESIVGHFQDQAALLMPVADFVRLGLQQMKQPKALQLLSHLLSDNSSCNDPALIAKLQENLKPYAPVSPGSMAPSLERLVDGSGKPVQAQPSEGLYIFWAADCEHCLEQLPQLHRWWSAKHPDWKVTTVSVGGAEQAWSNTIASLPGWTHWRDPEGRQGPTVEAYVLYATPLFVKVGRDGRIEEVFRAERSLELTY
ncbi:MAG: TlpA family protein disulfide reductase [Bacteroidota bacterium]